MNWFSEVIICSDFGLILFALMGYSLEDYLCYAFPKKKDTAYLFLFYQRQFSSIPSYSLKLIERRK